MTTADDLLDAPLYGLPQREKEQRLLSALVELTAHHRAACRPYDRIVSVLAKDAAPPQRLADIPWLPVGLFKSHRLVSVPDD
jgi:hypothetical protein